MKISLLFIITLSLSLTALSIPVGLNIMPIATKMKSSFMAQYTSNGSPLIYANDNSTVMGVQYADVMGFEGGVDQVSNGVGNVYNLKMSMTPDNSPFSLAVGAQGIGSKSKTEYYAVASANQILGKKMPLSLHTGLITNTDNKYGVMYGAQLGITKDLSIKADHVNGSRHDGDAIGLYYKQSNGEIGVVHYLPSVGDNKTIFVFSLSY